MSMNPGFAIVSIVTLSALTTVATADAAWSSSGERRASFKALGPGGLAIEGKGNDVTVKDQGNEIAVIVGLNQMKTGIDLRDRHMREKYLETNKYPKATFTVEKSKVKLPGGSEVEGTLQLHGVTKPIKVKYDAKGTDQSLHVQGTARLNMKDFGIQVPSYLGVTVKPDVTVSVQFDAVNK